MYSTPVKGTANKKTTMNWWEYWIGHAWMTGWQSMRMTFRIWCDLMLSRYDGYALMKEDDPETECVEWFWASLNEDDVYPKEFLEYLMQMCEDIELGKVETYSMDEVMDRLKDRWDDEEDT
ncbi:MAG: hypothetical protein ACO3A6_06370, partial [Candidatus Nanopelagicaceae bacterium]